MNNVNIKTTGWEMTDEISAYLDEKLSAVEKMLQDPNDSTLKCDVELSQTRENHATVAMAEINLSIGGEMHRVVSTGDTMQAALDEAKDEMQRQLRRGKKKQKSLLKRGGAKIKNFLKFGRE